MDNFNNIHKIRQPSMLNIKLYDHQLAMIYKMERSEETQVVRVNNTTIHTKLGVVADIRGHGKTLSVVGLILRDRMVWDVDIPYIHNITTTGGAGILTTIKSKLYTKLPSTLVLVSESIIKQWLEEFAYTNLRIKTVTTSRDIDNTDAYDCDVVLVIPSMYNKFMKAYAKCAWKRFVFDEPENIRVKGMRPVRAEFYWLISSTPNAITINHKNCRNSFMYNLIGNSIWNFDQQFEGMILKNDEEFTKMSFNMPKTHIKVYDCLDPILNTVKGIVTPHIIKMLEAGYIDGAINALGGTKTQNIVDLVKIQKTQELTSLNKIIQDQTSDSSLSRALIDKKVVESQLKTLNERFKIMVGGNCCICSLKMTRPVMEPNCQNLFCTSCLLKWLQKSKTCPLCREKIDICNLIYLEEQINKKDVSQLRILTKNETVIQIIEEKKNGKFLLYSSVSEAFVPICKALDENDINYAEVKGTVKQRERVINNFKNGKLNVLFLNSNSSCAGMNLQNATDIILYHKMSVASRNKVIGASNRIGRQKELYIHKLNDVIL